MLKGLLARDLPKELWGGVEADQQLRRGPQRAGASQRHGLLLSAVNASELEEATDKNSDSAFVDSARKSYVLALEHKQFLSQAKQETMKRYFSREPSPAQGWRPSRPCMGEVTFKALQF